MGPAMTAPHQPSTQPAEPGPGPGGRVGLPTLARHLGRAWMHGITTTVTIQGFSPGQAVGGESTLTAVAWRCAGRLG
jgi:hypothetical protein